MIRVDDLVRCEGSANETNTEHINTDELFTSLCPAAQINTQTCNDAIQKQTQNHRKNNRRDLVMKNCLFEINIMAVK